MVNVAAIFFPQREALKLDGHGYSPTILHRILHIAGVVSSFDVAQIALKVVGEINISDRQINELAVEIGGQLQQERDTRTKEYVEKDLPRSPTQVNPPPDMAAVFCDGGRMRTRTPGQGRGVHDPHWRETKNAAFYRMKGKSFADDPHPELPECFRNQAYVEKLVGGLKNQKKEGREEKPSEEQGSAAEQAESLASSDPALLEATSAKEAKDSWQPKPQFRTGLSSLASSDEFGPMMAAEADRRGFFAATKKAFLGDGLGYNWTIQQRWFPDFEPINDYVHVVEYLFTAVKALHPDDVSVRWKLYLAWATACWQGRVEEVIEELKSWRGGVGVVPEGLELPDSDPRDAIQKALTYLVNNRERMDYPRYRQAGLPVTSSLAESYVKQVNARVKGTEKFFDDGERGEAILQIRAAVLCEDDRLATWLRTRPISPYSPRCRSGTLATGA